MSTSPSAHHDDSASLRTESVRAGRCRARRDLATACVLACGGVGWCRVEEGAVYGFEEVRHHRGRGKEPAAVAGFRVAVGAGMVACMGAGRFEGWFDEV